MNPAYLLTILGIIAVVFTSGCTSDIPETGQLIGNDIDDIVTQEPTNPIPQENEQEKTSVEEYLEQLKETVEESKTNMGNYQKIRDCAKKCSGEHADIPAVYNEFYSACYELYYYGGIEEMESYMNSC